MDTFDALDASKHEVVTVSQFLDELLPYDEDASEYTGRHLEYGRVSLDQFDDDVHVEGIADPTKQSQTDVPKPLMKQRHSKAHSKVTFEHVD